MDENSLKQESSTKSKRHKNFGELQSEYEITVVEEKVREKQRELQV